MSIDWLMQYWWAALLAALAVILIIWLLLRPRQRVTLTDSAPTRPHMSQRKSETVLATAAAIAPVPPTKAGDDLTQLKGVGPKLAATLNGNGISRYQDLAALSPDQVAALDEQLGTFRGRLTRDRVVDQARYLATGDRAGFEAEFGKL